jgi:hypothetical protein
VLLGVWVLLVGTKDELELLAGACAAALGTVATEAVRASSRSRWLGRSSRSCCVIPLQAVVIAFVAVGGTATLGGIFALVLR